MKRVLVSYSHFAPAFKAGGPVQSLTNMIGLLQNDFQFFVICEANETGELQPLENIKPDSWNDYSTNVKVFYISKKKVSTIRRLFLESDPDIVYVNGMFLPIYNWLPLWLGITQKRKVVLAPRGMLQQGALSIKPLKKKIFLSVFNALSVANQITWHATDNQEQEDIRNLFGSKAKVLQAANVPKVPASRPVKREKLVSEVRLVYFSLITEKKNLSLVLKALNQISSLVMLDIYGPISDPAYWEVCQALIPSHHVITYCGVLNPDRVQNTLAKYHALILPTKGENFGHAIYEAFSVGTPAIISAFTPWGKLQTIHAGVTLDALNEECCAEAIDKFLLLDQVNFEELSKGAHETAVNYFYNNDFKAAYRRIFS